MSSTRIVNISKASLLGMGYRDLEHWLENPQHVYIGRSVRFVRGAKKSKWANPFPAKTYGRQEAMRLYRAYIMEQHELLGQLAELEGKILGCWCKPELCHGDILIELIER